MFTREQLLLIRELIIVGGRRIVTQFRWRIAGFAESILQWKYGYLSFQSGAAVPRLLHWYGTRGNTRMPQQSAGMLEWYCLRSACRLHIRVHAVQYSENVSQRGRRTLLWNQRLRTVRRIEGRTAHDLYSVVRKHFKGETCLLRCRQWKRQFLWSIFLR